MLVYVAIQLISTSVSCFHQGLKVHSIDPIFPVKNVKYVIEGWQKEVLLQVVMKKGKSPLGATYLHSSLKITSNLLAALEMLFYKELQLSNFAFKVSRKGFWNCKLQNVNINHFENTTHPHTRYIYFSKPLFT